MISTELRDRLALTGRRFELPKKFDLNEFLKGSLGVFKGQEDFEVVVELDAWAADERPTVT